MREEPLADWQLSIKEESRLATVRLAEESHLAIDLAAILRQRPHMLAWLRLSWLGRQSAVGEPLVVRDGVNRTRDAWQAGTKAYPSTEAATTRLAGHRYV